MKKLSIAIVAVLFGCGFLVLQPLVVRAVNDPPPYDPTGRKTDYPKFGFEGELYAASQALTSKHYDVAIRFYTSALNRVADWEWACPLHAARGDAYAGKGAREQARADYQRALNFVPKKAYHYVFRGRIYEKIGNYKTAAAEFAKAAELSPNDADILNSVAWFKATSPERSVRNGREAIQMATKACELTKWKEAFYIDTLAAAHAEAGNFEQAVKDQTQALSLRFIEPEDRREMEEHLASYREKKPFRREPKL